MGERSTPKQEPGYEGLCNYAQKITSCFGLDGKKEWVVEDGGGMFGSVVERAVVFFEMLMFLKCRDGVFESFRCAFEWICGCVLL